MNHKQASRHSLQRENILQGLIWCGIAHHFPVVLGEYPAVPLPIGPDFQPRVCSFFCINKFEQVLNSHMEYFCNIHSQFKGRIISAIFKVNDCFSSCTNKLCQFALFISCLLTNLRKVKFATWEDFSTRFHSLGMTCRQVIPFNHTGYSGNVAGGRLPPLRTHWWVVPFNRTGYIRYVAWR